MTSFYRDPPSRIAGKLETFVLRRYFHIMRNLLYTVETWTLMRKMMGVDSGNP